MDVFDDVAGGSDGGTESAYIGIAAHHKRRREKSRRCIMGILWDREFDKKNQTQNCTEEIEREN
jgi:hypothetical protein